MGHDVLVVDVGIHFNVVVFKIVAILCLLIDCEEERREAGREGERKDEGEEGARGEGMNKWREIGMQK